MKPPSSYARWPRSSRPIVANSSFRLWYDRMKTSHGPSYTPAPAAIGRQMAVLAVFARRIAPTASQRQMRVAAIAAAAQPVASRAASAAAGHPSTSAFICCHTRLALGPPTDSMMPHGPLSSSTASRFCRIAKATPCMTALTMCSGKYVDVIPMNAPRAESSQIGLRSPGPILCREGRQARRRRQAQCWAPSRSGQSRQLPGRPCLPDPHRPALPCLQQRQPAHPERPGTLRTSRFRGRAPHVRRDTSTEYRHTVPLPGPPA